MNTEKWFKHHNPDVKKVIVFQNLRKFLITSLNYDYINPDHKILVRGIKKRKRRSGSNNYEKIAILIKNEIVYILVALYFGIGWYLLLN